MRRPAHLGMKRAPEANWAPQPPPPCEGGLVNLRVGAIILKDGKLLMARERRDPYLYSVGGRIQFGETAEEAVVREVEEETGVRLEIDRLGFVHENYFISTSRLTTASSSTRCLSTST